MATATAERKCAGPDRRRAQAQEKRPSDGQGRLAWMLLAPTLIVIVVAGIPCSCRSGSRSTRQPGVDPTTGMVAGGDKFVGLQNYTDIFSGLNVVDGSWGSMDRFWNAFINTTMITIVCVLLETVLGVAMALIMAKAFRGRESCGPASWCRGRSRPSSPR